MGNLAIIPARGGSKRIPNKNIKLFLDKPIISYSIETAVKSGLFDEVMVSTDSAEIASIAKSYGAQVPFLRSNENSDDLASTSEVILEVLDKYYSSGLTYEFVCCIYPTAPMLQTKDVKEAFDLLKTEKLDSVFPVVPYSHPIQRSLYLTSENKIKMVWPENEKSRSQDLESRFHDAGQFYWLNVKEFLNQGNLFTNNSSVIVMPETHVQDIDSVSDWSMAEMKFLHNFK